jgi:hypothetical protein
LDVMLFLRESKTRPGWPMLRKIVPRVIMLCECQMLAMVEVRRMVKTYTLSRPMKAPWSWNADPLYPSVNS